MAEESVDKPISKQVNLSPTARRVLDRIKDDFGITQLAATERGLEFLLTLPPPVLQEVFRAGGDPVGALVRLKLAESAGAGDATTIEQAAAIAKAQVERLERIASAYRRELDDLHAGGKSKGVKKSGKIGG